MNQKKRPRWMVSLRKVDHARLSRLARSKGWTLGRTVAWACRLAENGK